MIFSAGETAHSSNPARCEHRGRQSGQKNLTSQLWSGPSKQQAAGVSFISIFKNSFYSFQCISKSQRIPEPISLLEGGPEVQGGETIRPSQILKSAQLCCSEAVTWSRESQRPGTDSCPTWEQSVFAHWSQHCQCYFIISFISAPIPNRFQRWTSVPLLAWTLCVSQFWQLVLVLAAENKFRTATACKKRQTSPTCNIRPNAVAQEELKRLQTFSSVFCF